MSVKAKAVLDKFRKLSVAEQRELLKQLARMSASSQSPREKAFRTVKVSGGKITSRQVADALDDE